MSRILVKYWRLREFFKTNLIPLSARPPIPSYTEVARSLTKLGRLLCFEHGISGRSPSPKRASADTRDGRYGSRLFGDPAGRASGNAGPAHPMDRKSGAASRNVPQSSTPGDSLPGMRADAEFCRSFGRRHPEGFPIQRNGPHPLFHLLNASSLPSRGILPHRAIVTLVVPGEGAVRSRDLVCPCWTRGSMGGAYPMGILSKGERAEARIGGSKISPSLHPLAGEAASGIPLSSRTEERARMSGFSMSRVPLYCASRRMTFGMSRFTLGRIAPVSEVSSSRCFGVCDG